MNCAQFRHRVDEYLEGSLGIEHEPAAAHLRACPECRARVARLRALRMALRELPVPETPADLWQRALSRARAENPSPAQPLARPRWPYAAGVALAASLALWLGFGWLPASQRPSGDGAPVTITMHQPRMVQLAFDARQELRHAALTIRLPAGVELEGFPGQREVRWHTDLARGMNLLSLPLIAVAPGGGSLTARLEHEQRVSELAVALHVATAAGHREGTCAAPQCAPARQEGRRA